MSQEIHRGRQFFPHEFIGSGWKYWSGPMKSKGLRNGPEQDDRSLALQGIDLEKVRLVKMLLKGELFAKGEYRLERLVAARDKIILLDLGFFLALWADKSMIPKKWENDDGHAPYIFFDGQILRDPEGQRCSLYMTFNRAQSRWTWGTHPLNRYRSALCVSAVLPLRDVVV